MSKTIVVVGFGPGVSTAVANRFGAAGFSVALVARNEKRLAAGIEALESKGIVSAAFPADAGNPDGICAAIAKARAQLGPITVLHWNAFSGGEVADLLGADLTAVLSLFDVAIVGLLSAVNEALSDLRESKEAAVLITNGAFGEIDPLSDEYAIRLKTPGVALANAAKHKLVGLLAQRLKADGIYVGEVMIAGTVKGTRWSNSNSIDPAAIADKFWELYRARSEVRARIQSLEPSLEL